MVIEVTSTAGFLQCFFGLPLVPTVPPLLHIRLLLSEVYRAANNRILRLQAGDFMSALSASNGVTFQLALTSTLLNLDTLH